MSNYFEYNDKIAFHPGYYIKEYIEDNGMTQEEFAFRLGTTPKNLSLLIRGEQSISVDIASKIARLTGTSIKYWINLQTEFDILLSEVNEYTELCNERIIFNQLDYSYFKTNYNLPDLNGNVDEQIKALREFLKISSLSVLENENIEVEFKSDDSFISPSNIIKANIMVQIATNMALQEKGLPAFDRNLFKKKTNDVLSLTTNYNDFLRIIQSSFMECGVFLAVLPNIKGSKVSGATKKIGNHMLIMVNDCYETVDSFWFTFMHEVGHIMKRNYGISYDNGQKESEADQYAADKLINPELYQYFLKSNNFTKENIIDFANSLNCDVGIIISRLQKDGYINYSNSEMNKLKHKFHCS
ncbi:MAG: HigA family addiction module antidote protein [Bacilli bacterium]|nr:HigA family addiction module antidote protein [Bacilli bacterium]